MRKISYKGFIILATGESFKVIPPKHLSTYKPWDNRSTMTFPFLSGALASINKQLKGGELNAEEIRESLRDAERIKRELL